LRRTVLDLAHKKTEGEKVARERDRDRK